MDAPQLKCMARADLIDTHVLCWLVIHVLSAECVCVQFISDLLLSSRANNSDLMRRSWHSIYRERRGKRLFLDTGGAEHRGLQRTNGKPCNFVLR